MPDLLLELFSEEIPARMQAKAADDLRRMVTDKLVAEGLVYEGANWSSRIEGVTPDYLIARDLEIASGGTLASDEALQALREKLSGGGA